ncbi:MAG: hypothetical protein ABIW50_05420 [Candidatus Limnocylindria bacterium]
MGFAPTLDDGYALVVGGDEHPGVRVEAGASDLLALAIIYFEEAFEPPPEQLAATLGDIGSLVRHVAEHETDVERRRLLAEAVDAVDDGLAADVTITRIGRALGEEVDATAMIRGRVGDLLAED